jgi:hypothetical protein
MFRRSSRRASEGSDAVTRNASTNARPSTQRAGSENKIARLTRSLPNFIRVKGIMKFVTEDESIHSKYGSESKDGDETVSTKRVVLKDIEIREYARTIGDNPSCTSGPPIA